MKHPLKLLILALLLLLTACALAQPQVLRLATTTSTDNSGLLEAILPDFEKRYNAQVDVIAVGTGQALSLGEAGDVDIILVHALSREDEFVANQHGTERFDVMYNDFVLVGPEDDPAGVNGMLLAQDALAAIAASEATFASRGDDSGTHTKERGLWKVAGLNADPQGDWYKSLGQGMGDTLRFADETQAYTLTDRGTFLALQDGFSNLVVLVGGGNIAENQDPALLNPYGVIPINPDKGDINLDLAQDFVEWLTSVDTQAAIEEFGVETFGQPLFYPDSQAWNDR
ncbi:MAG: tungstate ABC transporter [Chloroflexi bacterium]|nr:MAG: tungstate ABC transporter [Chloroflexota bacterium]MBL1196431.1 tungstate ABC transporter [Chloroflexota bacterium]NOH13726.1 solute-binding protein [Chloroflexota bacterium]